MQSNDEYSSVREFTTICETANILSFEGNRGDYLEYWLQKSLYRFFYIGYTHDNCLFSQRLF